MRVRRWWPIAAPLLALAAGVYVIALVHSGAGADTSYWLAGSAAVAALVAGSAWLLQRHSDRRLAGRVPAPERPEPWAVRRHPEVGAVVAELCRRGGPMVAVTTALPGAGGFGKTTVARLARTDRRVLRRFGDRVHWLTLSRDIRSGTAIAEKINELIRWLGSDRTFTDPQEAGEHLAELLHEGPPRLLVVDDVWYPEQLAPFKVRGGRCACLITTRMPELLGRNAVPVVVDRMSARQARKVLTDEFSSAVPREMITALATATGRWPLLLRLVNRVLVKVAATNLDLTSTVQDLQDRLHRYGAVAIGGLDVADRDRRRLAVRATIEASTRLLTGSERRRFAELGIFAADEVIPMSLITQLWRATGARDERYTRQLCARLGGLGLLTDAGDAAGLHDVVRGYLRDELGPAGIAVAHARMLETADAAWWEMNADNRYLWDHLVTNLIDADRFDDAERVVGDLRWVTARLIRSGPAAPNADLALVGTARTARLRRVLDHAAVLLAVTEPAEALINVLYSRVGHDTDWAPQVAALAAAAPRPRLFNAWPLPDIPDPALRRTIDTDGEKVSALAIARDGDWLVAAGPGEAVRIWDPRTGRAIAEYPEHAGGARTVAVSPGGDWLAAARDFGAVWIWDTTTGRRRFVLAGHTDSVLSVAIAPKGTWLASAGRDETIRIWDTAGTCRAVLTGHTGEVTSLAVAPNESWLASAGADRTVRIWDVATGECRTVLEGHTGTVTAVAVAPDGTWLASAGEDCAVWVWDLAESQPRAVLEGHTRALTAVAIAPDGEWLATAARDGTARIWDPVRGHCRAVLIGHTDAVLAVAIAPGGDWLATGGNDETVRTWDAVTGTHPGRTGRTDEVTSVAVAPDGSWLAAAGDRAWATLHEASGLGKRSFQLHTRWITGLAVSPDGERLAVAGGFGTTGIYSTRTGRIELPPLAGHVDSVLSVAISPGGDLLATTGRDRTVRIWSTADGDELHCFTGHTDAAVAVAFGPPGDWLASAGRDGTVRIWDLATAGCRTAMAGHLAPITAMALAPDGTWAATVATDETMRIWHVRSADSIERDTGHEGGATTVAISPDGGWLATGGRDGVIRIWNPSVAAPRTMMRVSGPVHCCAWMPGGKALAVGATTGFYLFGFDPGLT
jgi:WD40 repeat protein